MKPCPKHPDYSGDSRPDWNCRACRAIRKAAKGEGISSYSEGSGGKAELTKTTSLEPKTLKDIIRICEIDESVWEIYRWTASRWEVKDGPRYQIRVQMMRKTALVDARAEIESLKSLAKSNIFGPGKTVGSSSVSTRKRDTSHLMLEIAIPDLHLGKLAWSDETGYADYDSKIAEECFEEALAVLLERTVSYKFSEILLPLGNDLLHSDTKFGTTTAGTQLDTDSRYQKNFTRTRNLSIRCIERLRSISRVKVLMVPGNHDTLSCWHLGDSLECFFHATEGVEIDNSPCLRKYHQWGQVMLMFTHGDKGKLPSYPLMMATEQPAMFGETKHREAHTGHTHHLKVQEKSGVRIRVLSALCPPDAWHSEHGFVGNLRSAEAFIWHKEEGLIGTAVFTI